MSGSTLVVGIVLLSVLWFGALWCGICYAVALRARWPNLRRLYAAEPLAGATTGLTGYVGKARYRGTLIVASTPGGLYLDVAPAFRLGAGPVLIPWPEVVVGATSGATVTLEFPRADTALRVAEPVAKLLLAQRQQRASGDWGPSSGSGAGGGGSPAR